MSTFNLIQEKLNLTSANLSLISDNIANVNTTGYQRQYIDVQGNSFPSVLDTTLKKTNSKHINRSLPKNGAGVKELDAYIRTDGNGVDVDTEVVEMNKNKLFYSSLITLLNGELTNARTVITSK